MRRPADLKTGDLTPSWRIDIADEAQIADLNTAASWRFVAVHADTTLAFTDLAPTIEVGADPWSAVVTHNWVAGETDRDGPRYAEVVATWPDGTEQTFPSDGMASVMIAPSID